MPISPLASPIEALHLFRGASDAASVACRSLGQQSRSVSRGHTASRGRMIPFGEESGMRKRFSKIEGSEKGGASMTREFGSTEIVVWISVRCNVYSCSIPFLKFNPSSFSFAFSPSSITMRWLSIILMTICTAKSVNMNSTSTRRHDQKKFGNMSVQSENYWSNSIRLCRAKKITKEFK